jgi:hypothetical protein
MKKLPFIMMYTTMILYAHVATAQTGKSTDLVEFYADASPPCYKTEFKKDSGSFYNVHAVSGSHWARYLERNGYTNAGYLDGAPSAPGRKPVLPVNV